MSQFHLLTGDPRVGKTTLIKKLVHDLPSSQVGGFYTEEIQENGERRGFAIVTLEGEKCTFSHADITDTEFKLQGSRFTYGIRVECLEKTGVAEIDRLIKTPKGVIVLDEIGKMQMFSENFKAAVIKLLETDVLVLGTIVKASLPWTDQLKADSRVSVYELTIKNRDEIEAELRSVLNTYLK